MTDLSPILSHLDGLRLAYEADPDHLPELHRHEVDHWMEALQLERRQVCEVISVWLLTGFAGGHLNFEFADAIANDMHFVAQADASAGTGEILDLHTALTWETYLAFDAGEFRADPSVDPVIEHTLPLVEHVIGRLEALATFRPALLAIKAWAPAATS